MTSPSPDLMGPRFVGLAAVFYSTLFLAAVLFSALRDRNLSILAGSPFLSLSVGGLTACGTVALGVFLYRLLPVVQKLSDEIAPLLADSAGKRDLVLVSVFSGVGEEAFFRGALQLEFGLVAASVLFGALHVVPERRFFVWTLFSVGAGFLLGFLYERTGGLLAPVTAHVLHNAATLLLWKRSRRERFRVFEGDPAGNSAARGEG
jgi:membrane protease YdiL (CAAX protease family)